MTDKRLSERAAVARGVLFVNGPVLPLMFAPPILLLSHMNSIQRHFGVGVAICLLCAALLAGFFLAWVWWSVTVPKWRLWAYQRVDNIPELKVLAVKAGLTWPDGHFFERTEITSAHHKRREKELAGKSRPNRAASSAALGPALGPKASIRSIRGLCPAAQWLDKPLAAVPHSDRGWFLKAVDKMAQIRGHKRLGETFKGEPVSWLGQAWETHFLEVNGYVRKVLVSRREEKGGTEQHLQNVADHLSESLDSTGESMNAATDVTPRLSSGMV